MKVAGQRVTVMGLGRFGGGIAVSRWLDLRANQTLVQAVNPERSDDWSVTLQAVGKPDNIDRARHGSNPWRSTRFVPEPDVAYVVTIDPAPLPGDLLRVHSLLPMVAP